MLMVLLVVPSFAHAQETTGGGSDTSSSDTTGQTIDAGEAAADTVSTDLSAEIFDVAAAEAPIDTTAVSTEPVGEVLGETLSAEGEGAAAAQAAGGGTAESSSGSGAGVGQSITPASVNGFDGAFTYDYEIKVPLGRNGMQPELVLSYNSNAGSDSDLFGYGWSVDIPYIERINKEGIELLYTGTTTHFRSSLSGELVQVGSTDEYRAKVETGDFITYELSNNIWTAIDKDGTVYTFGSTTASQQNSPATTTDVFKWMVNEVRDTNDNYIEYAYFKDDNQIYPDTITYTGHGATDGIFEVDFQRELRTRSFKDYHAAFVVTTDYRFDRIETSVDGTWAQRYDLTYENGDNASRDLLQKITESGSDGATSITLPDLVFDHATTTKDLNTNGGTWGMPTNYFVVDDVDQGYRIADVNGDGLADLLYADFGTDDVDKVIEINSGTSWDEEEDWDQLPNVEAFTFKFGMARAVDVNGDGLTDLVFSAKYQTINGGNVYLNTGSGWSHNSSWSSTLPSEVFVEHIGGSSYIDNGYVFADVNGDGLPDILHDGNVGDGGANDVYLNTGSGWVEDTTWSLPDVEDFAFIRLIARAVDINRDGLADIVWSSDYADQEHKSVYLNTGSGWSIDSTWSTSIPAVFSDATTAQGVDDFGYRLSDINNDGLPDIVWDNGGTGDNGVYLNEGNKWGTVQTDWSTPTASNAFVFAHDRARLHDINGDGLTDIVWSADDPLGTAKVVYLNQGEKPDNAIQVEVPAGGTIDVTYKTSIEHGDNPHLPFIIQTVSGLDYDNDFGTTWSETYDYEGGQFHYDASNIRDRKYSGFNIITKTTDLKEEKTFFHQGSSTDSTKGEYSDSFHKIGFPYREEINDLAGNAYQVTTHRWEELDLGDDAAFVKRGNMVLPH